MLLFQLQLYGTTSSSVSGRQVGIFLLCHSCFVWQINFMTYCNFMPYVDANVLLIMSSRGEADTSNQMTLYSRDVIAG